MNVATKLGAFALGLAAVFGGAVGVGQITGPVGATAEESGGHGHQAGGKTGDGGAGGHGGGHEAAAATSPVPGGLQVSQDGYTLVPASTTVEPGKKTDFRFTVNGPDGKPVTAYEPLHGKKLHLIIARRDLSGFQHLHPVEAGGGVWSIPLTLPDPATYRFFTDVKPQGAKQQLTLGTDIVAPGDQEPRKLPAPERTARVGDYEVTLNGDLVPGRSSKLTLSVKKNGQQVTDLEPYLEAYGHLVALREGDLAYLHVHPDGAPGDGKTRPGPDVTFFAEVPSAGTYRLYLDFQHGGKVHTAEFTAKAGTTGTAPAPADDHGADGHTH